jgi:hypothetical protein
MDEVIAAFRPVINFHTGLDNVANLVKENIAYNLLGDVLKEQGNPDFAEARQNLQQAEELLSP